MYPSKWKMRAGAHKRIHGVMLWLPDSESYIPWMSHLWPPSMCCGCYHTSFQLHVLEITMLLCWCDSDHALLQGCHDPHQEVWDQYLNKLEVFLLSCLLQHCRCSRLHGLCCLVETVRFLVLCPGVLYRCLLLNKVRVSRLHDMSTSFWHFSDLKYSPVNNSVILSGVYQTWSQIPLN